MSPCWEMFLSKIRFINEAQHGANLMFFIQSTECPA